MPASTTGLTIAQSGYPDYVVSVWLAVVAPAKVPDETARILKGSLDRALGDKAFRASLEKVGYTVLHPQSAAEIDADRNRWSAVIKAQHISLD